MVKYYKSNAGFVSSIAKDIGIDAIFFLQPAITTKTPLTELEQGYKKQFLPADFGFLFNYTYANMGGSMSGLVDISGVFNGMNKSFFVDNVHITEEGNGVVAAKIAEYVSRML